MAPRDRAFVHDVCVSYCLLSSSHGPEASRFVRVHKPLATAGGALLRRRCGGGTEHWGAL